MQALPKPLCELKLKLFKSVVGTEPEAPAALRSTLAHMVPSQRPSGRRPTLHHV